MQLSRDALTFSDRPVLLDERDEIEGVIGVVLQEQPELMIIVVRCVQVSFDHHLEVASRRSRATYTHEGEKVRH